MAEMILSLIVALGAGGVLLYTIVRWPKFPLVPRTLERADEVTKPTERRKHPSVNEFRNVIDDLILVDSLVLREAHVSALADYDRIGDMQGADVAKRARELADKWWFGYLARALQRLDVSSIPQTSLVQLNPNLPIWAKISPDTE